MYLSRLLTLVPAVIASLDPALQNPLITTEDKHQCNCTGSNSVGNPRFFLCGDPRLGPPLLPWRFPLLSLVSNYDRFGGMTPAGFLQKWYDEEKKSWIYPKHDGFMLDTSQLPIKARTILRKGTKVDRFGHEGGRYVSAADAPFSQRALPPEALNVCPKRREGVDDPNCKLKDHPWGYHVYEVVRDIEVVGGPIAPAFEQPGLGAQFYLGTNTSILKLVENGALKRLNLSELAVGPGKAKRCGSNPINCECQPPREAFTEVREM